MGITAAEPIPALREQLAAGREQARANRGTVAVLAGLAALAFVLRVIPAGSQSIWGDEYFSYGILHAPTLTKMFAGVVTSEATPGLFYTLEWAVTRIVGASDFGIRLVSVVASTATVPAGYWLGRWFGGRRAGFYAAGLLAVHPALVWYGSDARSYSTVLLLVTVLWIVYLRLLHQPSIDRLIVWSVFGCLLVSAHYFASMIVVAQLVWLFATLPALRTRLLLSAVLLGAVGMAAAPTWGFQTDRIGTANFDVYGYVQRIKDTLTMLVQGVSPPTWHLGPVGLVALAALIALFAWAARGEDRRRILQIAGPALITVVLALTVGRHFFIDRNLIGILPVVVVLAAGGVVHAPVRAVGLGLGAVLAAVALAASGAFLTDSGLQRPDWKQVADYVGAPAPGKVVVSIGGFFTAPLNEYLHRGSAAGMDDATEIIAVGADAPTGRQQCYNGAMCSVSSATPRVKPAIKGLRLVSLRKVGRWRIATYGATGGAVHIGDDNAAALFESGGSYEPPKTFPLEP